MRALLPALALAACAAAPPPVPTPPPPPRAADDLVLTVLRDEATALDLVERLAASCWLDHVVGGANLMVARAARRMTMVSETEDLLEIRFGRLTPGRAELRLNGPAARDPDTARALAATLDTANRTGETAC